MIIIRLGNHHKEEVATKELIEAIKESPGSCDEVWFATQYGYPELDYHRECGEKITNLAKLYRDAGIKVSLQISNTIGHGEYMKNSDNRAIETHKFEKIVGPDGTVGDYSFCWRGENFTEYCCESIRAYMSLKPDTIWIDDDLRVYNHAPVNYGCYCDNCIKNFNQENGYSFTREELVEEINYGDTVVREKWIDFLRKGLHDFTLKITKAAMELSPDSYMAYQYARVSGYAGRDYEHVFSALKEGSGKSPKCRPGGGFYNDKNPMGVLEKMNIIGYANDVLPDYVTETYPEIESTPDVAFGKSVGGTLKESTMYLAYGCNGLTYAVLMNPAEGMFFHKKMLRGFSKYRGYWAEMISHNKDSKCGGVAIYESDKYYLRKMNKSESLFSWEEHIYDSGIQGKGVTMMKIGMPITNDIDTAKVYMLSEKSVSGLNDEDILYLMKKPLLIDGPGFKKIIEMGYDWAFDVTIEKGVTNKAFREVFTDHKVNGENAGGIWTESFFAGSGMFPHVIKGGGMEPLGTLYETDKNTALGASCAIVNVYDKQKNITAKWAVFGFSIWNDILSSKKRWQIIGAADYICDNTLPAILESPEQVVVVPRVNKEGKTVSVTLLNASIGETDPMKLWIRNPVGEKFVIKNAGRDEEAKAKTSENGYEIDIPMLNAWEIVTVFVKY